MEVVVIIHINALDKKKTSCYTIGKEIEMKLQVQINDEFDYEDGFEEATFTEVLIFNTPDDFRFDNKLGIEFLKTPEVKRKFKIRNAEEKNGEIYVVSTDSSVFYTTVPIMLNPGRFQDDFVEWLEHNKNVVLMEYSWIGG